MLTVKEMPFSSFPRQKRRVIVRLTVSSSSYVGPSHPWSYSETCDMLAYRKPLQEQQLEEVQVASIDTAQCRRPFS